MMKKLLIVLLTFAALAVICSYIFIPGKLKIAGTTSIVANHEAVFRILSDTNSWGKWWPAKNSADIDSKEALLSNGFNFKLNKLLYNQFELHIEERTFSTTGNLKLFPVNADSSIFQMDAEINSGSNPVTRITGYLKARKIKTAFDEILQALKIYTADQKNLYGLDIKKEKVQYSYLVAAGKIFQNYPTTPEIYSIIEELRKYLAQSGAKELFYPMLNIEMIDSSFYKVQVGLPIDKKVSDSKGFSTKWMMKEGNILTAEITGGKEQIEEAFKKFEVYVREHRRTVIAIPFQMLITDRTKEPDSTKWVTRLYYPVV